MYAVFLAIAVFYLIYSILPTMIYKLAFRKKCVCSEKRLFLTFDDGPSREYTEKLLDVLKKYKTKAVFFTVAEFGAKNPDIIKRMRAEGHRIGIHSSSHKCSLFRGPLFVKRDFERSIKLMESLGCRPHFYRPPWGQLNLTTLYYVKKYHLELVLWDVMAEDWRASSTPFEIEEKLLRRVKAGSVICLHDGRGADGAPGRTICALEEAIPLLIQQGFRFEQLGECGEQNG